MTADPATCRHDDTAALVAVHRLVRDDEPLESGTTEGYVAELTMHCVDCGERFAFLGAPTGGGGHEPTTSPDALTINLPMRPASAAPTFGMNIPGFRTSYTVRTRDALDVEGPAEP